MILTPSLKPILKSVGFFIFLFALFAFSLPLGISRLNQLNKQVRDLETEKDQLEHKVQTLSRFESSLQEQSGVVAIALPDENPIFVKLSQAKKYAQDRNALIEEIKTRSVLEKDDISQTGFEIELRANNFSDFVEYIKTLENSSPITRFSKLVINQRDESVVSEIEMNVYWSKVPDTITQIDQAVTDLSAEERSILSRIVALRLPDNANLSPREFAERENPFR